MTLPTQHPPSSKKRSAFTLIELLVVIAIIGILASMLLPALATAKAKTQATYCMNNGKQMTLALYMYTDDSNGYFPPNRDGGNNLSKANAAWVGGWLDYTASTDNTNINFLINHDKYPFAAYLGPYIKNPKAFKCPADAATVRIGSMTMPRVRSMSMNNYIGPMSRTWTSPSKYSMNPKLVNAKQPSNLFAFLDESYASINDGWYASDPDNKWRIVDMPAGYHGRACGYSFVDGHAEIHHFRDARTAPMVHPGQLLTLGQTLVGDPDIPWIQSVAAGVPIAY